MRKEVRVARVVAEKTRRTIASLSAELVDARNMIDRLPPLSPGGNGSGGGWSGDDHPSSTPVLEFDPHEWRRANDMKLVDVQFAVESCGAIVCVQRSGHCDLQQLDACHRRCLKQIGEVHRVALQEQVRAPYHICGHLQVCSI